ncbi:hypothetical protein [Sorangium sp. So ce1335]|uniref:hypothetical protein n=1 Tax=Sorangium sp. So ce1335 TaxID=3133335 RepID=UPI003F6213C8
MTFLSSLHGRTAFTVATLLTGGALLISCAGTLDDDEFPPGEQGAGGDIQGTPSGTPAASGSGGGTPSATTGGDPAATTAATGGEPAATTAATGPDAATTTSAATGSEPTGCAEATTLVAEKCATSGCHDANSKAAGLSLAAGWETAVRSQASVCGGMVLVPGDPDASSIYAKVQPNVPCGGRMPFGKAALGDSEIACLHDFIAALAP